MSKVSIEYAKALFELAMENDSVKGYGEALDLVSNVFSENPEYADFLSCLAVPVSDRIAAISEAFSDALPTEVLSFVKLLCENRHIGEFLECAGQYKAMLDELGRISNAKVTSAVALTEQEKAALKEKLEKISGKSVVIDFAVDKSILGGVIVEMDGKVMDSSLQKHLKEVKDVIAK